MATSAFIAARKALLAALLAAHIQWRDGVINPAIAELNAALPNDTGLQPMANLLTQAVQKINLYRPELDRLIAETDAMVPSDPQAPIDCVLSDWGPWVAAVGTGSWSACVNGLQSRPEMRSRVVVTAPANGGAACGPLTETRTATQACLVAPPMPMPVLGPNDIPDFAANPTIMSVRSGLWEDPTTWDMGRVPTVDDVVRIMMSDQVMYDRLDGDVETIGLDGTFIFDHTKSTKLRVCNLQPNMMGALLIGDETHSQADGTTCLLEWCDGPMDTAMDPYQYGMGLIATGKVRIYGQPKTTWLRCLREPKAGDMTLLLEYVPENWKPGDKLVLPDTRQTPIKHVYQGFQNPPVDLQIDEVTIDSIAMNIVALTSMLKYDHLGLKDNDGVPVVVPNYLSAIVPNQFVFPHVGNLTRNVIMRSENPNGVRGHSICTMRADIKMRYPAFESMGRTTAGDLDSTRVIPGGTNLHIGSNQIGRYPWHLHHCMGPVNPTNTGFQGEIIGSSVVDGLKWGGAIHDSHYFDVRENVIYQTQGAGIMTELGNETGNVIERNLAVKVGTPMQGYYDPLYGGVDFDRIRTGWEGSGVWLSGCNNTVRRNAVYNAAYAGYNYNGKVAENVTMPLLPRVRGADMADPAQWFKPIAAPSIVDFSGNEAAACGIGLYPWFMGDLGKMKQSLLWHCKQAGIDTSRNLAAEFEDIVCIADRAVSDLNEDRILGIKCIATDYYSGKLTFRRVHIEGYNIGIILPGNITPSALTLFDECYFRNYCNIIDVSVHLGPAKHTIFRKPTFVLNPKPATGWKFVNSGQVPPNAMNIMGRMDVDWTGSKPAVLSRLLVYGATGPDFPASGADFEYFFNEQASDLVMPTRLVNGAPLPEANCPTPGMTNAACWAAHGVATLGRVATCSGKTYPSIDGFTCPIPAGDTFDSMIARLG